MSKEKEPFVMVKRFRYSLDWYTVDNVKCETGNGRIYEMQYRLGCWYLSGRYYDFEAGHWRDDYTKDFRLDAPHEAVVALGESLIKFSVMHQANLCEVLQPLLDSVRVWREHLKQKEAECKPA
ncbi:hypothetical protein [Citrobacter werkmanii]|uniref:hypothetical protein n=1 Tax=Citrobacter werkmanii TaxID=67827 RepID=UPI0037C65A40